MSLEKPKKPLAGSRSKCPRVCVGKLWLRQISRDYPAIHHPTDHCWRRWRYRRRRRRTTTTRRRRRRTTTTRRRRRRPYIIQPTTPPTATDRQPPPDLGQKYKCGVRQMPWEKRPRLKLPDQAGRCRAAGVQWMTPSVFLPNARGTACCGQVPI